MKKSKLAFTQSVIALLLCVSMFVSTTFAWFTDSVQTGLNTIAAGSLDVEMYHSNAAASNERVASTTELFKDLKGEDILWEPGAVSYENLRIANEGDLALAYQLSINTANENFVVDGEDQYGLSQILQVGVVEGGITATDRASVLASVEDGNWTTLADFLRSGSLKEKDDETTWGIVIYWEPGENDNYWNLNNDKKLNEGDCLMIELGVKLVATQEIYERDSFGDDYDVEAKDFEIPEFVGGSANATVEVDNQNQTVSEVKLTSGKITATAPAGVKVKVDTETLVMTVSEKATSEANVILGENEDMLSLDVHIEGVAEDNTVPITVTLGEAAPTGLNMGNYKLYHVENGATVEMTLVESSAVFTAHNQFKYDPATGDITLYMATFSEVALVADTENAWNGKVATAFASGDGTENNPYIIANADQLAYLNAVISNDNDNYGSKHYKLIADVNLNESTWYPIGYWKEGSEVATVAWDEEPEAIYEINEESKNPTAAVEDGSSVWYTYGGAFSGTFDGNGHTISNIYQNTWQLKGDYCGSSHYWNDAMGLFGYVYNGTVKNLTVESFSSDGEFTPTGVIAAYSAGTSTFQNIAITNCNPRVYNTGNGGIIGVAGSTSAANDDHITLKNITVDNSNKISALWGSWDVACGGLVGMYRGNVDSNGNATGDTISFENCHVAAQIDVYNDVCANYQYYAYRYAGMIIGSVRNNTTNDEGKTIPNMTGISAKECTVNFGTWNDYYYCELVANTTASYTHDHQMSRLVQVDSIDVDAKTYKITVDGDQVTKDIPTSGRYNYVVVNGDHATENATCYHFVDGVQHLHDVADDDNTEVYETVNGESVLKEDKQHLYLEFSNLFTGYGWGVSSMAINKWNGITALGVTTGTQEESMEKFETKFTSDFLYRVGNQNTVSIGSLFAAKDGVTINSSGVVVTVDAVYDDSNVSGSFTANTDDWIKGTIQFSGTGVVKVTIQDYNFCKPTELLLEVVDATNLTSATGNTTGGNFVLLCDVNTSTYVNYWNTTLYGNGFTYSLNGAPTSYNSKQGHGILITKNATLYNLVIVGDVYDEYGAYTTNNDYNAAIDVLGDTAIQNCYISGCSAPVSTRANTTIKNTTLYGGTVGNLIIKGGTVTLENVTTANYNDGRDVVGMGIVVHSDAAENSKLVLNGTLTQYNFIKESDTPTDSYAKTLHNAMFDDSCSQYHFSEGTDTYVNTGVISLTTTFDNTDITDNANTGYVGQSVSVSGSDGYVYTQPNTSGSVNNDYNEDEDTHIATTQGAVPPSYSFDYTTKNYVAKVDGSNDYCYEENGIVSISMDDGDSFDWDTSILTVTKGNETLDYTVSMNGTDYTGKSITFNTAGDYVVEYTYTDPSNYKLDENGNITTYSETYTKTVNISVAVIQATTKHAEFTMGSSNAATEKITIDNATYISATGVTADNSTWTYMTINGQNIYYPIVAAKLTSTKGSSTYAYFPVFENVVTITDYADGGIGDAVTYNSSTTTLPSGLTAVKGIYKAASGVTWSNLTDSNLTQSGASAIFKWASSSSAPSDPETYSNVLCYKSPQISADRDAYITLVQYSYTDEANTTYYYYVGYTLEAFTKQTTCVTPDTLVTLADDTQKRIDEVTYADQLLAWDFFKGEYAAVSPAIIFDHGIGNNTVIKLNFSDGTSVKVVNLHQFFDADLNEYVSIDAQTVSDYVGHEFIKRDGKVTLVDYSISQEYVEAWGIISAMHYNIIVEGMLSTDFMLEDYDLFNYLEVGDKLMFDEVKMQADIEKHGLYTYADFADYLTYEQFVAFNVPYFKIAVGKGNYTYEGILALIDTYLNS